MTFESIGDVLKAGVVLIFAIILASVCYAIVLNSGVLGATFGVLSILPSIILIIGVIYLFANLPEM